MILRIAAAGSLALGLAVLSLYLMELGEAPWSSPESRHLRGMKNRSTAPAAYAPVTFDTMRALPAGQPLAVFAPLEQRGVSLEGYVQILGRAADGDFHLDFAPRLDPDGDLVPYLSAEITPQWQRGSVSWSFERLAERFRPTYGGRTRWESPPRRSRISGWLMNDFAYEGVPPVFGFPPHVTHWEIHPVTRIEVWDDSLGGYAELER